MLFVFETRIVSITHHMNEPTAEEYAWADSVLGLQGRAAPLDEARAPLQATAQPPPEPPIDTGWVLLKRYLIAHDGLVPTRSAPPLRAIAYTDDGLVPILHVIKAVDKKEMLMLLCAIKRTF